MTCWRPNCSTLTHRPLIVMMFNLWSVVGAHTGGECIHFQYNQYNCVELAPAVLHLNARQKERKRSRERKRIVSLHERAENHLNFKSWHVDILEDTKTLKFTQAIMWSPKRFCFVFTCADDIMSHKAKSLSGNYSPRYDFNFLKEKPEKVQAKRERGT